MENATASMRRKKAVRKQMIIPIKLLQSALKRDINIVAECIY
jgi:hypothetical protein